MSTPKGSKPPFEPDAVARRVAVSRTYISYRNLILQQVGSGAGVRREEVECGLDGPEHLVPTQTLLLTFLGLEERGSHMGVVAGEGPRLCSQARGKVGILVPVKAPLHRAENC